MVEDQYPLLIIVGPTGSGKTALSLAVADGFAAEIVSCDSVAVYREFEIGTAKPSREERVRVPHHMVDVVAPDEEMTAGEYARQARAALAEIRKRGKLPIVVGGTGLYLRALTDGLFAGPARSETLRDRLRRIGEKKGGLYLHRMLRRLDPHVAAKIHANDIAKLIRAIEVCFSARMPMTALLQQGRDPLTEYRMQYIGLNPDRHALYNRINKRCERMFASGLVEETRVLLSGHPQLLSKPNSPLNALGYKQAVQHIRGELSLEQALSATAQAHRNYAKRQLTWFRNQHKDVQWFVEFGDDRILQQRVLEMVSSFLR